MRRANDYYLFVRSPLDASVHHRVCKRAYRERPRRINCASTRSRYPPARKSAASNGGREHSSNKHNYALVAEPLAIFAVPHDARREWAAPAKLQPRCAVCISISPANRGSFSKCTEQLMFALILPQLSGTIATSSPLTCVKFVIEIVDRDYTAMSLKAFSLTGRRGIKLKNNRFYLYY